MSETQDTRPLSTGEWFVTMLILAIPFVNVIMYLVWAFGGGNVNRRNFCRAGLIWVCISLVFVVGFMVLGGGLAALAAYASSLQPQH